MWETHFNNRVYQFVRCFPSIGSNILYYLSYFASHGWSKAGGERWYIGSIILGAVYFHKVDCYEQVIAYASKGNQILGWPSIMTELVALE